ncbi:MAG: hypothetical protein EPO26_08280 [Chloroflexota bacterium]|nr:MAG: hypothetical protein EPO26_08280 [Chloroflexota bacterium]
MSNTGARSANAQLGHLCAIVGVGIALSLLTTDLVLWIVVSLVTILACLGADSVIHAHWRQTRRRRHDPLLWVFPALTVAGSSLVPRLSWFDRGDRVAVAILGAMVLFGGVVYCQMHSLDRADPRYRHVRTALTLLAYVAAAIVFTGVYGLRARSALSATAAGAAAFVVAIELMRGHASRARQALAYAAVVGIAVAEVAWALNYWPIAAQAGGILLLVALYVFAGILQAKASGRLSRRDIAEFSMIGIAALSIVIGAGILSS